MQRTVWYSQKRPREVTFLFPLLLVTWTVFTGPTLAETISPTPLQNATSLPNSSTVTDHSPVRPGAATTSVISSPSKSAKSDSDSSVAALIKNVQSAVQALAIIIAGIWAYFKFIKGRVFTARLEPTIDGTAVRKGEYAYVSVKITLKNVGLSKVQLIQEGMGFKFFSTVPNSSEETLSADWKRLGTFPAFPTHSWIEPSETITDEQLIIVPGTDAVAYRVEFEMSGGKTYWSANGIIQDDGAKPEIDEKWHLVKINHTFETLADKGNEEKDFKPKLECNVEVSPTIPTEHETE